jgi:hypothetical protein
MLNCSSGPIAAEKQLIHWGYERTKADRSTRRRAAEIISNELCPTLDIGFEYLQGSLDIDASIKQGAPN